MLRQLQAGRTDGKLTRHVAHVETAKQFGIGHDRGVLVRNCASWPRLGDCLRVSVGTPEENDRFLSALEETL